MKLIKTRVDLAAISNQFNYCNKRITNNDYDDLVINCTSGEFSITSATDPATFLWTAPNTAGGGVTIINNGTIHGTTVYNSTVS